MGKTIAKEIIIGLLLCLAILLLLSVMMYSFTPNNKTIPNIVEYTVPEEAKKVLEESSMDSSQVILSYEVNSSDLSTAQRTNDYNPGKVNPFSSYQVQPAETGEGGSNATGATTSSTGTSSTTAGNTSNSNSSTSNTSGENTNSNGGTYYKDKGTK